MPTNECGIEWNNCKLYVGFDLFGVEDNENYCHCLTS